MLNVKCLNTMFYIVFIAKEASVNANLASCTIENARTTRNSYITNYSYCKKLLRNYQRLVKYY